MRTFFWLVRRELGSYFASLTGYLIIASVVLLIGSSFNVLIEALAQQPTDLPITQLFYSTFFFWIILLLAAPVITMRAFALEKSSGTYETLMTTPVGDGEIVLAKFSSSLVFYVVMWLPLLACVALLGRFVNDSAALDPGPLASTFLGIVLLGGVYVALGCFASALTRSQIVAATLSVALGTALFLLSFLARNLPPDNGGPGFWLRQFSLLDHMEGFVRGVVDTRAVVCLLSLTALFLFLTLKVVEGRRWR
jgi:ABC-2 type transport system permease protein